MKGNVTSRDVNVKKYIRKANRSYIVLWQTYKFETGKRLRDAGFIGEQGWCECETRNGVLEKAKTLMNLGVLENQIKVITPQEQKVSIREIQNSEKLYEAIYTIDSDISAKIGGYKSIEALKEESKSVIEILLKRYGIPDGSHQIDVVICEVVDAYIDHDEFSITVEDKKVTDIEM